MPGYAAQPVPQQALPGTVVTDPWDDELESVIAELQALQQARAQMAAAPEPVRYEMPADDVPPMMRNALAGGGQVGPAADNALAFDPDPRANPYMSLRPMPGRTMQRAMDPMAPVRRVERTDPFAMEQQSADDWQRMADVSGVTMARSGVGNIGEGVSERDPLRVAGGAAQVGLAALPYGGPFARRAATWAFSSPWAPARVGGAALAAGPGAEGTLSSDLLSAAQHFFGSPAEAQTRNREAATARARAEEAKARAKAEEARAKAETQIEQARTEAERARLEAQAKAKGEEIRATATAQREADEARAAAEDQQRRKLADMPTRERWAAAMPYVLPTTMALAATAGGAVKGLSALAFNRELKELGTRWENALARSDRAKGAAVKERAIQEAEQLGIQFNALKQKGPGGSVAAPLAGGVVGEIGYFAPEEIDLTRALMGSNLYDTTMKGLFPADDPWNFPKRFGMGALMGAGPAELSGLVTNKMMMRNPVVGYGAETTAARNALGPTPQRLPPLPAAAQLPAPAPMAPPAAQAMPNPPAAPAGQGQRVLVQRTDSLGRVYHVDPNSKYPGRRVSAPRQP